MEMRWTNHFYSTSTSPSASVGVCERRRGHVYAACLRNGAPKRGRFSYENGLTRRAGRLAAADPGL